jgi:GNAT superfamily N-acetyltransferase
MPDERVLADLSFAEWCRMITRNVGGRVLDLDGLVLWSGVHPSPAIINGTIRTGAGGRPSAAEVLDIAAAWFGEIGHGYTLHVRVGRDDDLEAAAQASGFLQIIELPVMVYDGPAPDPTVPDGYTLSRVTDEQGMRDLVAAVAVPFELPDEVASAFSRIDAVLAPFVGAVVARDRSGRPVAGAWTAVSHGVAGVGFVGALDEVRGRGLGTAVTAAAMRLGYAMGARSSALQASPMGRPVYARMGFREIGTYRVLVDPASAAHMAGPH